MKKLALYLTAFLTMIVYALACSDNFMKLFIGDWDNKNRPTPLQLDKYKYGDLYGMSYLRDFKQPVGHLYSDERAAETGETAIDLWVIGDSFLVYALKPEDNISFLKQTKLKDFWWWYVEKDSRQISFEEKKINVLLIESTERLVRENYSKRDFSDQQTLRAYQVAGQTNQPVAKPDENPNRPTWRQRLNSLTQRRIVTENFSQNAELLLFGYEMFAPFKELKAGLNFRLFDRVSPEISVSRNHKNLFYKRTTDSYLVTSSFNPLSDGELNEIVKNINYVAEKYKERGFDEVLFSITPNAVTIIDPEMMPYNNLIPRLQNHPDLKVPVIDVYSRMKDDENKANLYWINDTHWNSNGFHLWVDETNNELLKIINRRSKK